MISRIWQSWSRFWFEPVGLLNLAIFRILFCSTMAIMYLNRQRDVGLFFTDSGILPKSLALKVLSEGMRPAFLLSLGPDSWIPFVHVFFIFILILMALGIAGRILPLIAVYLQIAFLFRNYSVAFGADQIGTIFLTYLAFTQSEARLSVRSWWRKRRGLSELCGDTLTSVFYRMIQLQLCVIYFYSGLEKLKGVTWWDGTALWSVLANSQMVIADFTWVRHVPLIVVAITFTTILFEIYFPVMVWNSKMKKFFLSAGVFFHAGIGVVMALWSFALVMIAPYVLFLPEPVVQKILSHFHSHLSLPKKSNVSN